MLTEAEVRNLSICAGCGQCLVDCPVYKASADTTHLPLFKGRMLRKIYESSHGILSALAADPRSEVERLLSAWSSRIYECTLCGACSENCKYEIEPHKLWYRLREYVYTRNYAPDSLKAVVENLRVHGNPYGLSKGARRFWLRKASSKVGIPVGEAKTIYFIGCTTVAKHEDRPIAISMAKILNKAGVDWAILGVEEPCCGAPIQMIGDETLLYGHARRVVQKLREAGAETVVTACPTCYRMLSQEYKAILGGDLPFKVEHSSTYVKRLIEEGYIRVGYAGVKAGYHDPCELSRHTGIISEPRRLMEMVGYEVYDPDYSGEKTFCCGGGGMIKACNAELSSKVSTVRVHQLARGGVDIIVTACPSCKSSLSAASSGLGLKVLDIVEAVAQNLEDG